MTEKIELTGRDVAAELFGLYDGNINLIKEEFGVDIALRDAAVVISGNPADTAIAAEVVRQLIDGINRGGEADKHAVREAIDRVASGDGGIADAGFVATTMRGKRVKPKTAGQRRYVEAIKNHTITFGIGPAGTGKTYLAVCLAVSAYKAGLVERIILTRPAIEAGEKLGFLPGDLQEKVNPYLQPLYDALSDLLGAEGYPKLIERGIIIIAPLAYMRGRTLNNAFAILDEAQNTTEEQMKMFLTRLGEGSKMVITGDITQIDLPRGVGSGLKQAAKILEGINDIGIIRLSARDVVRHELVSSIIKAYDNVEDKSEKL